VYERDFWGLNHLRAKLGSAFKAGALLYTGADTVAFGDVSLLCRSPGSGRRDVGGRHGLRRLTSGTSPEDSSARRRADDRLRSKALFKHLRRLMAET
jgi:hypothetical protein